VRLRAAPDTDRFEWRNVLSVEDFSAPCRDLLYMVAAPVGYSMARKQPLQGLAVNAKARWDTAVAPLCSHFEQLCIRHNRGDVTLQEFGERTAKLQALLRALTVQRRQLDAALRTSGREPRH
jgi:hypothetical protein